MVDNAIRCCHLFSGIEGFRYGLEACNRKQQKNTEISKCRDSVSSEGIQPKQSEKWWNFTCVYSNDNDRWASAVSRYHYRDTTHQESDIRTVDPSAIPEHDLLCAGFPCQSFSIAGARGGLDDIRGTLFQEICRVAGAKRTPYLFLENVKGLLSAPHTEIIQEWKEEDFDSETNEPTAKAKSQHHAIPGTQGWVFLTILNSLWKLGYDCQWQVLNSKDYGVPQNRERVFIIGHFRGTSRPKIFPIRELYREDDEITEPDETASVRCLGDTARNQSNMTVIRTIQGGGHSGGHHLGMTLIHTAYPDLREYEDISPTISTPSGGGHLPYVAQALQTDGQLRDGASWGTDKPQSTRNIRRLTPIECERLQGFSDNWTKYGLAKEGKVIEISDTQRYKMCGNAVTTNVITAIGKQFLLGFKGYKP